MKRLTPAWLAVSLACCFSAGTLAADALQTKAFSNMPADFIKGADISTLLDAEKHGAIFYDQNNQRKDPIAILKENGVNYVRLRLWVDPQSASGEDYGGGNNDLATTLALAKRAKAQGMKLLLDFHYSDFWTDPGRQNKPKAWASMNIEQMTQALHDYTKSTVAEFKKAGVLPDMVQIGNEINGGMLWPEGKSWGQNGGEFDRLAGLLKAGINGVKENLDKGDNVKIMLHLAEGTKNDTFTWWFDEVTKRDVQFDVIGLSFYTYWNGPISALKYNMDDISKRYNKDLIVVEAAYGYTTANCDNAENNFTSKEADDAGYPATVQGQANYLHDLLQVVTKVPEGRGKGVKPILGAEVYLEGEAGAPPARLLLLVQNRQGYLNLSELLARAWTQGVVKAQAVVKLAWLHELAEAIGREKNELARMDGGDAAARVAEDMQEALAVLRGMDPPGVGAVDLRDSLLIQLEQRGLKRSLAFRLVKRCWRELAAHKYENKRLKMENELLRDFLRSIGRK